MTTQFTQHTSRAWIEVDVDALRRNAQLFARRAGVPILPMVKADAYGHGAIAVTRALESLDPWGYGVATVGEGAELRQAGIDRPIVIFTPILDEELADARDARLTPSLHRATEIATWRAIGGDAWHLAIDTGMGRAGVRWDDVDTLRDVIAAYTPEGAYTHFHSADEGASSIAEQEARFTAALAALPVRPAIVHAENSPAVLRRAPSPWSVVRPGIGLYGVGEADDVELEPVAHVRARIVDLRTAHVGETVSYGATWRAERESVIATVPCGYADGYRRHLGNRGVALLHGRRIPVVGVVTMDMTMLDVTDVPCAVGDVVTLLGRDGGAVIGATELARLGGLSPYEVLAGLRLRLPHVSPEVAL
jgi:alanine racemase